MPKENTHLFFAYNLIEGPIDPKIKDLVSHYIDTYLLGSISPDTFFYTPELKDISSWLHGKDGTPTNRIIIETLETSRAPRDLAFILGFITHCALDITFHPVIYYLSGNYYDHDPARRQYAVYTHRLLETCLDSMMGNHLRIHRIIRPEIMDHLAYPRIISRRFSVKKGMQQRALRHQLMANALFDSNAVYALLKKAMAFGIKPDPCLIALFYGKAKEAGDIIPKAIEYRDLITGKPMHTTIRELMNQAEKKATDMMVSAFDYA
ncbi:MAG: zinc dependent phospholipase C family protein, partial [Thermodesulfobacteriota bacterium]|nr:zinc dependent phospholipase C family protein [Thermodesulfobacteriota bacterium]